ncbi:hypothetical protein BWQ96_05192 [Gracilariopsis chorda]|uniref:ASPIC/UnbV domain-containing protein n=1 Tax=Gracilariopsis chorda TaxID=448386 RepID=A0A2V3ISF4_9FLOR|nr:hypothetical protein BWQ96_05192 [Gracilariopsis chorda]|eukprot:PXF45051.1 hypothetical protein BWQ96_05192 [Gracilariopsis chorda]
MYSGKSLFLFTLPLALLAAAVEPSFRDTTLPTGIITTSGKVKKYGSPSIVDLDRDGYPDLLFCHHDSTFTELYFNNRDGSFSKAPWGIFHDSHGFSAFPISPWHKAMRFTLSVGGNFGMNPANPLMFQVDPYNRSITEVTNNAGITERGGRGRMAVFLDLSQGAHPFWPDVIFTNAHALQGIHQFAYENVGNQRFAVRHLKGGFEWTRNQLATVTDIDNDGVMEVLSYYDLHVWKITAPFHMVDVSNSVLPPGLETEGVAAIAEIDFDNDGDFDLYLARDRVGAWMPQGDYHDILLENRGGKYYDVSVRAGIPRGTKSRGVTAADFNNDGFVDLHVSQYTGSDIMLINNGDGTFRRMDHLTTHAASTRGDHAVAVDYDMDGRVDLVMSEGDHDKVNIGGTFKIFQNNMPTNSNSNYIHVRVGNPWNRSCTPLNAVVTVKSGNLSMTRRVGSPGTSVSHSYVETLHFGLGSRTMVDAIYVKYTNGYVVMRNNVRHGQTVVMGLL